MTELFYAELLEQLKKPIKEKKGRKLMKGKLL